MRFDLVQILIALLFGMMIGTAVIKVISLHLKEWARKERERFARSESLTRFFNYTLLIQDSVLSRAYILKEVNSHEVDKLLEKYCGKITIYKYLHSSIQADMGFIEVGKETLVEYGKLVCLFYLCRASYKNLELDIDLYKLLHRHVFSHKAKINRKGQGLVNRAQTKGPKRIQKDDVLKNLYLEVMNFANNAPRPNLVIERVGLKSLINPQEIDLNLAQLANTYIHTKHFSYLLEVKYSSSNQEVEDLKKEIKALRKSKYYIEYERDNFNSLNLSLQKQVSNLQEVFNLKEDQSLVNILKSQLEESEKGLADSIAEVKSLKKQLAQQSNELEDLRSYKEYASVISACAEEVELQEHDLSFQDLFEGWRVVVVGGIASWRVAIQEEFSASGISYIMADVNTKKLLPLTASDLVLFNIRTMGHADYQKVKSQAKDSTILIVRSTNLQATLAEIQDRVPSRMV